MTQKIIYSHKLYNSWQRRSAGQLKQEHERLDYIWFMYNSVECKNSVDIVSFLYLEQIIKVYTLSWLDYVKHSLQAGGLIETLDRTKSSVKRGREVDKREDNERMRRT